MTRPATSWLASFVVLLLFQVAGTAIAASSGLPIPGPVLGLALLGLGLVVGRRGRTWRRRVATPAADSLLSVLPLLFVPAGVGVVSYLPTLGDSLLAVLVALVVSVLATLLTSSGLLNQMLRRRSR